MVMNKRKTPAVLSVVRITAFCLLLTVLLHLLAMLFQRKESIARMQPMFRHAEEIDVLFTGDSQINNGIYPMELWDQYGITSYVIASHNNTMAFCYWTTMNALDYVHPKLLVVGVKDVDRIGSLPHNSGSAHDAFDPYPLTRTKFRSIMNLMNHAADLDNDGQSYDELKTEFLFPLAKYHTRWRELPALRLDTEDTCEFGAERLVRVFDPREYTLIDPSETDGGVGDGYPWLLRLIDDCRARGIQVMLTLMPHPSSEHTQRSANTVCEIAEEKGVEFVDFVRMDSVIDYVIDMQEPKEHMNPSGAWKTTDYLGRFMQDHYGIPDHRGDSRYQSWHDAYQAYTEKKHAELDSVASFREALMLMHDPHYSLFISARPGVRYHKKRLYELLQNIPRANLHEENAGSRSSEQYPLELLDYAIEEKASYCLLVDRKEDQVLEFIGDIDEEVYTSFGWLAFRTEGAALKTTLYTETDEYPFFAPDEAQCSDLRILVVDDFTGRVIKAMTFSL